MVGGYVMRMLIAGRILYGALNSSEIHHLIKNGFILMENFSLKMKKPCGIPCDGWGRIIKLYMNSKQRRNFNRKFKYHYEAGLKIHIGLHDWCNQQFGKDNWVYLNDWPWGVTYKFKYAEHRTWFVIKCSSV
jgi:hypothetical protein